MKFLGLLMVNHEDDILADTLALHARNVDAFYVLDGTRPNHTSRHICQSFAKCRGYTTDADLPRPPYPASPVDGYRQHLYEQAVADHGWDNWFLLLHADEVWTFDPADLVAAHRGVDGFVFPLPCYFPRAGQGWDDEMAPLEQLTWNLGPGWPEFRMFRGSPLVRYDPAQHFNTAPQGIRRVCRANRPIKHYPYRSPRVQRERAVVHQRTGFDPDNYRHIVERDEVFWTDEMIARMQQNECFRRLEDDAQQPLYGHRTAFAATKAGA